MSDSQLRQLRNDRLIFTDTSGAPKALSIVPCLLCTKPFLMLPFIGVPDQVCPECEKTYKNAAKVVCTGKNAKSQEHSHPPVTICRLVPKVLENGFYIRPNAVLHTDKCNTCWPGLDESSVIEIEQWQRVVRPRKIIITK